MVAHGVRRSLLYAGRVYLVADFVIGPILVLAAFAGVVAFELGLGATWVGVPWPLAFAGVGLAWAGITKATWRGLRWGRRLLQS
jgi:hypothetical protein